MKIFKNKNLQKSTGGGRINKLSLSGIFGNKKLSLSGILSLKPKGKRLQNKCRDVSLIYLNTQNKRCSIATSLQKAPSRRGWGCPGFTLVELIVVITILAILSTIGFVAYSGYLAGTRDTNRISQLKSISDGLEMYRTKHDLPTPDNYVQVKANGNLIAYQGYVGKNVLETIEYTAEGKDPKDGTYFSYYLTKDKKYYQLMAYLEEADNLQTNVKNVGVPFMGTLTTGTAQAIDYTTRYPTVYGKKLGILTDEDNTPIQELEDIKTNGLDVVNTNSGYIARFSDTEKIEGTGAVLAQINPKASCKRIKDLKGGAQDGVYEISPEGGNNKFKVYCDMTTDGGGWTYATMLADNTTKNLFKTANTNKITSLTENISTKGQISDIWRDDGNKDIMVVCKVNDDRFKDFEIPFIIYDYKKFDINNLEKDKKAGTIFSSENLKAKWKNYEYILKTTYGSSTDDPSIYFVEKSTGKTIWGLGDSRVIAIWERNEDDTYKYPSRKHDGGGDITLSLNKDTKNYCMTAIR